MAGTGGGTPLPGEAKSGNSPSLGANRVSSILGTGKYRLSTSHNLPMLRVVSLGFSTLPLLKMGEQSLDEALAWIQAGSIVYPSPRPGGRSEHKRVRCSSVCATFRRFDRRWYAAQLRQGIFQDAERNRGVNAEFLVPQT